MNRRFEGVGMVWMFQWEERCGASTRSTPMLDGGDLIPSVGIVVGYRIGPQNKITYYCRDANGKRIEVSGGTLDNPKDWGDGMTDETNLVAIYRAGWRFWPAQEDMGTETLSSGPQGISPQLHQTCLDESFEQYTNIWEKLGKGLSGN